MVRVPSESVRSPVSSTANLWLISDCTCSNVRPVMSTCSETGFVTLSPDVDSIIPWTVGESDALMVTDDADAPSAMVIDPALPVMVPTDTRVDPEDMVILSTADAQTLFAPVLEKCDLDCPCVKLDKNGEEVPDIVAIKQCETRKALVRAGVSQIGLGTCPYSMLIGRKG